MVPEILRSTVIAPAMLVAACGDNLRSEPEGSLEVIVDTEASEYEQPARPITASFDVVSPSCTAPVARFQAIVRYADDPTSVVPNVRCLFTFEDGAVSTSCAGEHTFAEPGLRGFSLEVEDLDTGEVDITEETRFIAIPLTVDLSLDVPSCGLTFSYDAVLSTPAETVVTMTPPEQFLDPTVSGTSGTFTARKPGVYTLHLLAEEERSPDLTCRVTLEREVELVACPDHHEHDPTCAH